MVGLVEGIEVLPNLAAGEELGATDHRRNARCVSVRGDGTECREDDAGAERPAECQAGASGLLVQDLARLHKTTQELCRSLPRNASPWRRRESNPRPGNAKNRPTQELHNSQSSCGLGAEQNAKNPLNALARKWPHLSPELKAALRALAAAAGEGHSHGTEGNAG